MIKVEMLYPQGYCAGVKNAIAIAKKTRDEYPHSPIFIVGYLVHNKQVIETLESLNIHTLYDKNGDYSSLLSNLDKSSHIIFPAHGHDEFYDNLAKSKQLFVTDAVCPKVKSNADLIKKEILNNHQVIYIGISKHPETAAALSISKNIKLFDMNNPSLDLDISDFSPLVVNQTTLNYLELAKIHEQIKNKYPLARFQNEICNSTRKRQEAISMLPKSVDCIIVVGDNASSNTNRLLEIAKTTQPQADSYLINNVEQMSKAFFENKKHIVISSGASTPTETINMIYAYIVNSFAK